MSWHFLFLFHGSQAFVDDILQQNIALGIQWLLDFLASSFKISDSLRPTI